MPKAQITSKDLLLTAIITLGIAAVIIGLFIVLSGRSDETGSDAETLQLIEQIKQQAAREADTQGQQQTQEGGTEEAPKAEETTITGILTAINGNILTVIDDTTGVETYILLTKDTATAYNGSAFDPKNFYTGDQLTVYAIRDNGTWIASRITVRLSASPETAAPVPQGLKARPDGSLKPL